MPAAAAPPSLSSLPMDIEGPYWESQEKNNACSGSRKRFGGVLFVGSLLCIIFFFVGRLSAWSTCTDDSIVPDPVIEKPSSVIDKPSLPIDKPSGGGGGNSWSPTNGDEDACLKSTLCSTWSAVHPSAYELWDFNIVDGDETAIKMLSPGLPARQLGDMKGVAQLSYALFQPGVNESKFAKHVSKTDGHPGKVYMKLHFNKAKAELAQKKPINLEFEVPFFGMNRMALNPVYTECTGIVELVAARLYQTTMGFTPGTAPVRVFHSGKLLGLYTAGDWGTDASFLDQAFPVAHKRGTRRVWEGRAGSELRYVGKNPDLYKRSCREEGCTYCKRTKKVGGLNVCDREGGVGEDCSGKRCWRHEEVYQGKWCCAKPDSKPKYMLLIQDPSQASEDDAFKDLGQLVEIIHNAVEKKTDSYIRRLESSFDVEALLDMAAVDIMIGNWDGYWASGNNYFVHQSGADSASSDIGKFSIFQIDLEAMFSMAPSGKPYDSSYTVSWPFPTGLSMCSMPFKEENWPNSGERKCVVDRLIAIPRYHARFIEKLRKVVDRAPEIIQMFQRWSQIIYPTRMIELEGKPNQRWAVVPKNLVTCSVQNLQPQLHWYIDWINKRWEYLNQELAKLDEVAFA